MSVPALLAQKLAAPLALRIASTLRRAIASFDASVRAILSPRRADESQDEGYRACCRGGEYLHRKVMFSVGMRSLLHL